MCACQPECPVEAISEGDIYVIDPELCTECGACADVCPVGHPTPGVIGTLSEAVITAASQWQRRVVWIFLAKGQEVML